MSTTVKNTLLATFAAALLIAATALFGCAGSSQADTEVAMQYITPTETQAVLGNSDYVILDLRKTADFDEGHIEGAYLADMDAAKNGDLDNGVLNMEAALEEATGEPNGAGKDLVLVCYSGQGYAKAGTEVLDKMGVDLDTVYTMEGGMKAWDGEVVQ